MINEITIDLHTMQANYAKQHIIEVLNKLDPSVKEVTVIHGYRNGTALKTMVQKELKHPRIKRKILSLNLGQTILILK